MDTVSIIMQAQQYRMPPEEFVRRIQEAGQLGAIYADVRRTKALIAAVRAATVTDATGAPVDLSDLLAQNQEDDADGPVAEPVDTAPVESTVDADEEAAPAAEAAARAVPDQLSAGPYTPTANTRSGTGRLGSGPRRVGRDRRYNTIAQHDDTRADQQKAG